MMLFEKITYLESILYALNNGNLNVLQNMKVIKYYRKVLIESR